MLNKDRTRQLLWSWARRIPREAIARIDVYLGDNDLHVASELRHRAEMRQSELWKEFYEKEVLPAAKKGVYELVLPLDRARAYFSSELVGRFEHPSDLQHSEIIPMFKSRGLNVKHLEKGRGGGRSGSIEISWRDTVRSGGKSTELLELTRLSDHAQNYRSKNTWIKFFNKVLLPRASMGFVWADVDESAIGRLFNPYCRDDIMNLCKAKAIQCHHWGFRRTGSKGKGKGKIEQFRFLWDHMDICDGRIMHESNTGVDLLKAVFIARNRIWGQFFSAYLQPHAEEGYTCRYLSKDTILSFFPFWDDHNNKFTDIVRELHVIAEHAGCKCQIVSVLPFWGGGTCVDTVMLSW